MSVLTHLLPDSTNLKLESCLIDEIKTQIKLIVSVIITVVNCPVCNQPTHRIHSRYERKLADLPWADYNITLQLRVRKFFCINTLCNRRIFTERLNSVTVPWARRTLRLAQRLSAIALANGGAAGVRLSEQLGIKVSRNTLLNLVRSIPLPPIVTPPKVLNVKKNPIKITQNMVILGEGLNYFSLIVIINSFPKIVKDILKSLPKNDYPVLNSRLFFECWLSYALDNSLTSMRDLFQRLNNTGFEVDISTFSKASSHRAQKPFQEIYQKLNELVQKKIHKKLHNISAICPIDSTIITLTSKLLWVLGHHQVKLFSSLNLATGSPEDNFINFGHAHDYKFGSKMMSSLPTNAVGVMDRGFAGLKFIQELVQENKYFVLRIKNNCKLEFEDASGLVKVGASDDAQAYRVINFCDLETKTEFRLVTNLPESGDAAVHDDEIREIYRLRWGVELLWKFLKMHLKLDKLITKNVNGITIQIYVSLIAYLILQLLSIPEQWGHTLLDKFRYLQSCMCQKISYVHWFEEMMLC